ncbi:hypothetical protein [Aeromonas enteropelogenes]|uniref:hypothetical protein n=1 Tax=Aeromonas enteropelogenes TaxID=29489 RepID=UPI003B9EF7C5
MDKKVFRDVAVILAFGTGLLYILGQSYYGAWLRTLGLSSSFLVKDTPQMLQMGFAPFYTYGLWAILALVPVFYFLMLVAKLLFKLLTYLISSQAPSFYKEVMDSWNSSNEFEKLDTKEPDEHFNLFDFIVTNLFFVFLAALLYTILGAWRAEAVMADIVDRKNTIYELENENISVVACSSVTSLCAIYNYENEAIEIISISDLAGASVVSRPPSMFELFDKIGSEKKI